MLSKSSSKYTIFIILLGVLRICYGKQGFGSGEQEWGFVNVREGAHMFYWLHYTIANVSNYFEKPLVIWLQGGPGESSSGFGNFEEIGPFDIYLKSRNHTWIKDYNVLFIDNPVGTGFSYTITNDAFARTNQQIALDLLVCIETFLQRFPQFKNVSTYIVGESYGGKMAVEFANLWYKKQKAGEIQSNLRGVGLGDAWISPIDSVLTWAPFLLQIGMIDTEGYLEIMKKANKTRDAIVERNWTSAYYRSGATAIMILNLTNNIDFYNVVSKSNFTQKIEGKDNSEFKDPFKEILLNKLMNSKVKDALKINSTFGNQASKVISALLEEFMQPVIDKVELLLNLTDLKVFVYTGQFDLIVDTPGTLHWVEELQWINASNWKKSSRRPIVVNNIIEGYVKSYGNFNMYWINRAGHSVNIS